MATGRITEENSAIRDSSDGGSRSSYWKKVLSHYERRNASLERKQATLRERVRFMECAMPSLMIGAVVDSKRVSYISRNRIPPCSNMKLEQCCSLSSSSALQDGRSGRAKEIEVIKNVNGCLKNQKEAKK